MTAEAPRKRSRWLSWIGYLALFVVILFLVQWWQTRHIERGPAPALAGPGLDGRWIDLGKQRGGPVLVHFWATWCPVCRLEQGAIDALAGDYRVITVATRSGDAEALQAYLAENGLSFPVIPDETGVLASRWQVRGVPASFVIDAAGDIRHAVFGLSTGLALRARLWLSE